MSDMSQPPPSLPPVLAVVGWKNSGKTGLVVRLVQALVRRGLSVSTIKHAHHNIDLDQPGRDSWRHREAGAHEVALATSNRLVIQQQLRAGEAPPTLLSIVARMARVDIILAEGFKHEPVAKLESWRPACRQPPLAAADSDIFAIAAEGGSAALAKQHPDLARRLPVLPLNDSDAILTLALQHKNIS